MQETNQDASGATEQSVSDQDQINSINTLAPSGSDKVAYETHKKLLGEKKKLQSRYEEMEKELSVLNENKLASEGKKDELLEAYKKRIGDLEGKVNDFAFSSVSNSVRLKAKEMGCVDDEDLVKLLDLSSLTISDGFATDADEVKTMLEDFKKKKPHYFRPVNPNVNNSVPNVNPNVEGGKVDFSQMSKEELAAYGRKHGL